MPSIQYPYALDAKKSRRHISDSQVSPPFSCGDCNGRMVPKRGRKNRWHFAHQGNICTPREDPDNFLHHLAIEKIVSGFHRAKESAAEFIIGQRCAGFTHPDRYYPDFGDDMASADTDEEYHSCAAVLSEPIEFTIATITTEVSVVPGTISDIVITSPSAKPIIIEVVNTHPPSEQTALRYSESGNPIYIKKVSWDTIDELDTTVLTGNTLNIRKSLCPDCDEERKAEEEREAKRTETLERRKKIIAIRCAGITRQPQSQPLFTPWYEVSKENWIMRNQIQMFPKTQFRVFANAIILTELGFQQHNPRKPHLFRLPIRQRPSIVIYADLGGSDEVPIYEDTGAMLYCFDLRDEPELEQYAITAFGDVLQRHGVECRTGFESAAHLESIPTDPTRHVNRTQLRKLIR